MTSAARPQAVPSLAGKTAFVTGGAGHLGQAFAKVLLDAGARVVIADRDADRLDAAAIDTDAPDCLHRVALDVSSADSWKDAHAQARRLAGPIHLLVNNAALPSARKPLHEIDVEAWDRLMAVNLGGVFLGIREIVPALIAAGAGHVLNVASLGGLIPLPGQVDYAASKAAVISLSASLRKELSPSGIGVSVLCPGPIGHSVGSRGHATPFSPGRMDPLEGARRAVAGILRNDFYILTHADGREAVMRNADRLIAAFPG